MSQILFTYFSCSIFFIFHFNSWYLRFWIWFEMRFMDFLFLARRVNRWHNWAAGTTWILQARSMTQLGHPVPRGFPRLGRWRNWAAGTTWIFLVRSVTQLSRWCHVDFAYSCWKWNPYIGVPKWERHSLSLLFSLVTSYNRL